MWQAIRRKKPDRVLARHGQDVVAAWRQVVSQSEDLLTSAVLERLGYLPQGLGLELLLRSAEVGSMRWIPIPAPVEKVEPWPNIADGGLLEPDWVWQMPKMVVVVEAKWGRGKVPSIQQLSDQRDMAKTRWPRSRVLQIALIQTGSVDWPVDCNGLVVRWRSLREQVLIESSARAHAPEVGRLLTDILGILDHRGLGTRFFDSLAELQVGGLFSSLAGPVVAPSVLQDLLAEEIDDEALLEPLQ